MQSQFVTHKLLDFVSPLEIVNSIFAQYWHVLIISYTFSELPSTSVICDWLNFLLMIFITFHIAPLTPRYICSWINVQIYFFAMYTVFTIALPTHRVKRIITHNKIPKCGGIISYCCTFKVIDKILMDHLFTLISWGLIQQKYIFQMKLTKFWKPYLFSDWQVTVKILCFLEKHCEVVVPFIPFNTLFPYSQFILYTWHGVKNVSMSIKTLYKLNCFLRDTTSRLLFRQGCHTTGNSWKNIFFFSISPGNLLENHRVTRFCDFCEFCKVSVVLMRKKTVLPRIMSRMGSLITFKHCHSRVSLISVWNRFSDKIKHFLEWFLW